MLRAIKKADSNVIIAVGHDEQDTGNYPKGSSNEERLGVFCSWTFENFPEVPSEVAALIPSNPTEQKPFVFKENGTADGIEVRTVSEIEAAPQG